MTGRLSGKIAIVTGAASGMYASRKQPPTPTKTFVNFSFTKGIGRATAILFAKEGASVVCSDLRPGALSATIGEALEPTHETIIASGAKAIYVKCDVRNASEVEALVNKSVEEYGRLDIMVNNAGVGLLKSVPVWDVEEATWDSQQEVNAKSVFLGCKYASKQMISQEPGVSGDRGWIVNTASIVGLVGFAGVSPYCASKHAVAGITKTAALDCAPHRVHVNAVCPGCKFGNETNHTRETLLIVDSRGTYWNDGTLVRQYSGTCPRAYCYAPIPWTWTAGGYCSSYFVSGQ